MTWALVVSPTTKFVQMTYFMANLFPNAFKRGKSYKVDFFDDWGQSHCYTNLVDLSAKINIIQYKIYLYRRKYKQYNNSYI